MKISKKLIVVCFVIIGAMAFTAVPQEEWKVPAEYQKMVNPTDAEDEEGLEIGEELYMKHCKSCHGKEGLGDGSKAAEQEGDLGDFSSEEFQAQSDGSMFYKTKIGRLDMPGFEKKITDDEELWFVVNYMKMLGE
jgi:mono/diheme cytochrome c family protein